jgi:protein KRI1
LLADDKDLNAYVSVKKYAPYKKGKDAWDKGRVERLKELKEKVKGRVERTWGDSDMQNQGNGERVKKKRMGKKERSKMAEVDLRESEETLGKRKRDEDGVDVVREESEKVEVEGGAKKKRKRRKKTAGANEINA